MANDFNPSRSSAVTLAGRLGVSVQSPTEPSTKVRPAHPAPAIQTIDLVLLDGAKALYPEILSLVESRLRPGAFVIADNADYSPACLARVRSPANGYLSTPFAEDVELSMRIKSKDMEAQ
ncbi:MAG TPA: hypothetical protein VMD03_01130 [Steroidobacteraceae bacterium]|nr:hypothetical protein [Steroidobacteraceae bacterium]